MRSVTSSPLQTRRRAHLLSQIEGNAYKLFAEHGFSAVTTEDIAVATGISISTYFRHVPAKEDLLIAPVRQTIVEIVESYEAGPDGESAAETLIRQTVASARQRTQHSGLTQWRQGILTAPHLLTKAVLISEDVERRFTEMVAARMGVDARSDMRPSLLIATSLATSKFVLMNWLNTDHWTAISPLHLRLEQALRITLAGFD
ncbi:MULTISPECIES: TetR/AcrR family transcriptional regulator [Mycobacterium]|uniref:HTH tetR-type domain-containing protein n=2 Tax=Mycobacterium TaxID=1763 RepID=A0A1A3CR11_MYCAS|nr:MULTISPECIES: TetR/AcrR family transcriptional regulator [Mycobacterium]MCV6978166.1 TetR family transcriptional regulator [Mycobacterium bourgelatii]OBI88416.1 hypothetical protein A5661_05550 [Mycobacterium asiaticum]OBK13130.1 hypothetical protein A5636_09870 [Mycobacterium asiaticum]GFG92907.1 TetR family transcriptional regulator [Mycobacterium bourgelatii]